MRSLGLCVSGGAVAVEGSLGTAHLEEATVLAVLCPRRETGLAAGDCERLRPVAAEDVPDRLHGDRDELVRIVELPPRRKRYRELLASGEQIRRGFERKLDEREPEPEADSPS